MNRVESIGPVQSSKRHLSDWVTQAGPEKNQEDLSL